MLFKREGSPYWQYEFVVEGLRYRGSTKVRGKSEALKVVSKLRQEVVSGATASTRMTLGTALDRYYREKLATSADWKGAISTFKLIQDGIGAGVQLDQINAALISDFVAKRLATRTRTKTPVSAATINRNLAMLKAVVNHAKRAWGATVCDVDWRALKQKAGEGRDRYLTEGEVDAILRELPEHTKPLFLFSLLSGVRRSNALNLDWSQVDWKAGMIRFKVKSASTAGGKFHTVPLTIPIIDLLTEIGPKAKGPVFLFRGRKMATPRTAWANACERAGVTGVRWHDIRHTTASWLVQKGVPLEVVKEILGHSNIAMTMRYAKHAPGSKLAALSVLSVPTISPTVGVGAVATGASKRSPK